MILQVALTSLAAGGLSFVFWFWLLLWAGLTLGFVKILAPADLSDELWEAFTWIASLFLSIGVTWAIFRWGKRFIPPI